MNEVEKHYAGVGDHEPGHAGNGGSASRSDKGAVGDVTGKAREGLKGASETARDAYDKASDWGRDRYRTTSRSMSEASRRSAAQLATSKRGVEAFVEENPVMVGVVGLAAGLLLGALLPGTARENQVFGRYADEVRDQGLRYARDLAEQGKSYVEESLEATTRTRADRDTGDETRAS